MLERIKSAPTWIWMTLVGVGTLLGLVVSILSIWNAIDTQIEKSIQTSTILITSEIHKQTNLLGEFLEDDLYERIVILEVHIDNLRANNEPVPTEFIIFLKSMRERLDEVKGR